MAFAVKEIYYTLQGEGAHAGRPAVFCRFSGCNLWSGREQDRASAVCSFCDTEFVGIDGRGGGSFKTERELADSISTYWPSTSNGQQCDERLVVCTGGEPLLQLNSALVDQLHDLGFTVAVETNGTRHPPSNLDWICCSPKSGAELVLRSGHELKLVFPQPDLDPSQFADLDFGFYFLQPMAGPEYERNLALAMQYCLEHPQWRLSLQLQKILRLR